ncbi:MAG: hypothetical protein J0I06_02480 [Planctomycetes bacterium]|nr:hypothetical protein [Planctomycetota bacterium]
MSGWKGGGLLLVLAIPLALYAAWQVKGVVRADMVVSDAPPDRGAPKEQLIASKDKTTKWAADVRKASAVVLQYRQPEAGDTPADGAAAEVVKASATRSVELRALDQFLSGVEKPDVRGSQLAADYDRWKGAADRAREDGRAVTDWLARPLVVATSGDANRAMNDLESLLATYQSGSNFASRRQAAVWRIRGRLAVIKELSARADASYPTAVAAALPLKSDSDALKAALVTFEAVKNQVKLLRGDIQRAEEEGAELTGTLRGEIDERYAVAAKCGARERLLGLFAREDLFTNAAGAAGWLRDVATLYRDSKDETDKRNIRKKVQEFCEAFLPAVVRLDDDVRFKGSAVKRKNILIEYETAAGAAREQTELSDSTDGLNEFNAKDRYQLKTTDVRNLGVPGRLTDLEPTALSRTALLYNTERKAVPPGISGPKWNAKSVEDLKKKCEAQTELVDKLDKLKLPRKKADTAPDDEQKIRVRLEGLLEGLRTCSELVE